MNKNIHYYELQKADEWARNLIETPDDPDPDSLSSFFRQDYDGTLESALALRPPNTQIILVALENNQGYCAAIDYAGNEQPLLKLPFTTPIKAVIFAILKFRYGTAIALLAAEAQGNA